MAIQTLFGSVPREPNLLDRLKAGIQKTRSGLVDRLEDVVAGRKEIDAESARRTGICAHHRRHRRSTVEDILERIRQRVDRKLTGDAGEIRASSASICWKFCAPPKRPSHSVAEPPAVVMVVGVNGAGKTTTIGKLAQPLHRRRAQRPALRRRHFSRRRHRAIGGLGRAHRRRMIRQKTGADPSAVVFDALQAAKARKVDYVIVDTAGRLHTKYNLMAELEKMRRTAVASSRARPRGLLVLDATTGQNGLEQARKFTETAGVTGIVLTKLDGTAKGGVVVAIARELNLPIRYIGVGEKIDDLVPFEPEKFVESLFD